jgi:hypothetical protein
MERIITAFLFLSLFSGTGQARAARAPGAVVAVAFSARPSIAPPLLASDRNRAARRFSVWKSCLIALISRAARLTPASARI